MMTPRPKVKVWRSRLKKKAVMKTITMANGRRENMANTLPNGSLSKYSTWVKLRTFHFSSASLADIICLKKNLKLLQYYSVIGELFVSQRKFMGWILIDFIRICVHSGLGYQLQPLPTFSFLGIFVKFAIPFFSPEKMNNYFVQVTIVSYFTHDLFFFCTSSRTA